MAKNVNYEAHVYYRKPDNHEASRKFNGKKGSLAEKLCNLKEYSKGSPFIQVEGDDGIFVIAKSELIYVLVKKSNK